MLRSPRTGDDGIARRGDRGTTAVTREVSQMTRGRLFGVELQVREPIRLDRRRDDDPEREPDVTEDEHDEAERAKRELLAKLARYGSDEAA
jgi:hypothetical protein